MDGTMNFVTKISSYDTLSLHADVDSGTGNITLSLPLVAGDLVGVYVEWSNITGIEYIKYMRVKTSGGTVRHIITDGSTNYSARLHEYVWKLEPRQALFKGVNTGDVLEIVVSQLSAQSRSVTGAATVAGNAVTS